VYWLNFKSKEELARELENVKTLYFVGIHYSHGGAVAGWTRFRIYYVKDGELEQIYFPSGAKEYPPYWVPLHQTRSGRWIGGYFECRIWGVNRCFWIAHCLSRWLYDQDYRFKEKFLSWID